MAHGVQFALQAAAFSDRGAVRNSNQDAWSYARSAGVFVVCDGMGGAAGGEIASQLAAEAFVEHISGATEERRDSRMVAQAVVAANRRVHARAAAEPALCGMGTTLVGLVTRGGKVAIVHVGDSRCYRLRQRTLLLCTRDHSLVEEQLRMGLLSPEQAGSAPLRHVITRAVGTARSVEPEVQMMEAEHGDCFLLCTDGLTRELTDPEIAALLAAPRHSCEMRAEALARAAIAAGGRDNVTCLVIDFDERDG